MVRRKSLFSLLLSICLLFTAVFPVMSVSAASIGSDANDTSVGYDTTFNTDTQYQNVQPDKTAETDVYATVDSSGVMVWLPKTVIVSGTANVQHKYTGEYAVKVTGDIAGTDTISVIPEKDISLTQSGKNDMPASVSQNKEVFAYDDLKNGTMAATTGAVTAKSLTAGSWKSEITFTVTYNQPEVYYSSLEDAVADANALSTDNADVKPKYAATSAVAAVSFSDDMQTAYIDLLNDSANTDSFTLEKNTVMNLHGKAVSMASGKYITYNGNLYMYNGTVKVQNAIRAIQCATTNTASSLTINGMVIDNNITSLATGSYTIDTSSKQVNIDGLFININTVNTANTLGAIIRNTSGVMVAKNLTINNTGTNASGGRVSGMQTAGDVTVYDYNFNGSNKSTTMGTEGIRVGYGNLTFMSGNIVANGSTGVKGIVHQGDLIQIFGGTIIAKENISSSSATDGASIGIHNGTGTLLLDEQAGKIIVKGTNSAVQSDYGSNIVINGGYYASPNHGGIYCLVGAKGSCEINGGVFANNYSDYSEAEIKNISPFSAAYFGHSSSNGTAPWSVKIKNATFINDNVKYNEQATDKILVGICLKGSDGYVAPTVTLTNCTVFGTYYALRCDDNTYGAKFILEGNTAVNYNDTLGFALYNGNAKYFVDNR